jgi:hypothetical protein
MSSPSAAAAPLKRYASPANINDFGANTGKHQEFLQIWNWNLNGFTLSSILGNPWGSLYDLNRYFYFNPLKTPLSGAAPQQIAWFANSGRIQTYFGVQPHSPYNLTPSQLMQLTDQGFLAEVPPFASGFPAVPGPCPTLDYTQPTSQWQPFADAILGPRGWQDEYCEYSVARNAQGKITSIMFTCENPEYWYALWQVDPNIVLSIYRSIVNPHVQLTDLYLPGADGKPVVNPQTGLPAYNPLNKWNSGTVTTPTSGGAVHLTSPPNSLGAEVYLAAAATLLRNASSGANAQSLICCSQYGQPFRNSDPHIGFAAYQFATVADLTISLADPVGLYIQEPQFDQFAYKTPDGTPASDYWKVVRGDAPGQILHAVFEVPASKGYTVSDITINGEPILWASQIAATFQIALEAWGQTPNPHTQPAQTAQACPVYDPSNGAPSLPALAVLMDGDLLNAYNNLFTIDGQVVNSPTTPAPILKQGTIVKNLVLQATNVVADPVISFGPGIKVKATLMPAAAAAVVRKSGTRGHKKPKAVAQAEGILSSASFSLELTIADDAATGQRNLSITNPGQPTPPATPCVLTVVGPEWPKAN